jgi:hypothetical protein
LTNDNGPEWIELPFRAFFLKPSEKNALGFDMRRFVCLSAVLTLLFMGVRVVVNAERERVELAAKRTREADAAWGRVMESLRTNGASQSRGALLNPKPFRTNGIADTNALAMFRRAWASSLVLSGEVWRAENGR